MDDISPTGPIPFGMTRVSHRADTGTSKSDTGPPRTNSVRLIRSSRSQWTAAICCPANQDGELEHVDGRITPTNNNYASNEDDAPTSNAL